MSKKLLVFIVVLFLGLAFWMFSFIDSFNSRISEATGLVVSADSFPVYLETNPAINDLPGGASVEIAIGDNLYKINGRDVSPIKSEDAKKDIKIFLPEGYENVIGELGLCGALKKAYVNKEISFETYSSKMMLFLKYHKLLKYNSCLG
jgi:hypothetical protein